MPQSSLLFYFSLVVVLRIVPDVVAEEKLNVPTAMGKERLLAYFGGKIRVIGAESLEK